MNCGCKIFFGTGYRTWTQGRGGGWGGGEGTRGGCTLIQSPLGPYNAPGAWFTCPEQVVFEK